MLQECFHPVYMYMNVNVPGPDEFDSYAVRAENILHG